MDGLETGSALSGSLQDGQRLANPGLPGRNSNSSPQTAQVLMGKDMRNNNTTRHYCTAAIFKVVTCRTQRAILFSSGMTMR